MNGKTNHGIYKRVLLVFVMTVLCALFAVSASAETISDYSVGDIIKFGTYPQSEVTDEDLLNEFQKIDLNWQSYGYYSGDGSIGSMKESDYMKYADIEYDGNKYRAVTFSLYRPVWPYHSNTNEPLSQQVNNGYLINKVYWFKYEPLKWRILDPETGLIMCSAILDSQAYCNNIYVDSSNSYNYYNDAFLTTYSTDYETSTLRDWLNKNFFGTAFNNLEQTQVYGVNRYCKEAKDKAFLLSRDDVCNINYGFTVDANSSYGESNDACDPNRILPITDYAKCQGLYTVNNHASWLIYAPAQSREMGGVSWDGSLNCLTETNDTSTGICPAMTINLNSINCNHEFQESVILKATCSGNGTIRHTCKACNSYYDSTIPALNHTTSDWIIDNNADCIHYGSRFKECTVCHVILETQETPKTDHFLGDWVYDWDNLVRSRKCSVCDYTETEPLEKTENGGAEIIEPVDPDTEFVVEEITKNGDKYAVLEKNLGENLEGSYSILKTFDITLQNKNGVHVQPDGIVKVKLPLDWDKDGDYKVYRVNDDGTLTDMEAYREGSHMVFDTDHFSLYVIVDESPEQPEEPAESEENNSPFGFLTEIIRMFKELLNKIITFFQSIGDLT